MLVEPFRKSSERVTDQLSVVLSCVRMAISESWIVLLLFMVPDRNSIGIPCLEKGWYARNIWDMVIFDGRLFVGCGNSSNQEPAANAGPVGIWAYEPEAGWTQEYVVDEEQIDRFDILDGSLAIPGHDSRGSWDSGNWYSRAPDGTWTKHSNIPRGIHVYDLISHDGLMFAALGSDSLGNAVAVSSDDGSTWVSQEVPIVERIPSSPCVSLILPPTRIWALFTIGERLYANSSAYLMYACEEELALEEILQLPENRLLEWDGIAFRPTTLDLFPGSSAERIVRATTFHDQTVFISAMTVNDHQWVPLSISFIDADLQPHAIELVQCSRPQDIDSMNNVLYVLCNQPTSGVSQVNVYFTCDLDEWGVIESFEAPTFARSFAVDVGVIYFGLGADAEAFPDIRESVGDVLRVPMLYVPTCAS